jgi:uncharacterized membrane protein HdeD (DUF308 family)
MSRSTTRWLMLPVILLILTYIGIQVFTPSAQMVAAANNGPYLLAYLVSLLIAASLTLIALIGALTRLSQLQQMRWFWLLLGSAFAVVIGIGLVLTPLLLVVYSVVGPTEPAK